jgi:cGMP-dependent protein kinase
MIRRPPRSTLFPYRRSSDLEFFGERALITNEPRKANVIAVGPVECLVLERSNFTALLNEVHDQLTDAVSKRADGSASPGTTAEEVIGPKTDFKYEDLKILRTIGTGTFGRVKLVQHKASGMACALKAMNKSDVVASHQEINIMAEKNLLFACSGSRFVLGLLQTYNFPNQIFMLMEFIQGGELWSYIYEKTNTVQRNPAGGFEISAAKFYASNVILAFKHLHAKNIAYRDLKPENLLIDGKGYVKVIDFGFAKKFPYVKNGKPLNKTFTLCGTPEYLAPEIVMSKGYDKSVDCWALGCLIFELSLARTPFQADYTTKIFQNIVNSDKVLSFPPRMDPMHVSLVRKLLNANPAFRIGNLSGGIDDIMRDPFFSSVDWAATEQGLVESPYKPAVTGALDAANFDAYDEETGIPPYTGRQDIFAAF